jgi:hypothetical protein
LRMKTFNVRFFTGCLIVLTSTLISGCSGAETETTPSTTQRIHQIMPAAPQGSRTVIDYTRNLTVGDEVTGSVMVTEAQPEFIDWATPWTFEAWDPNGVLLDSATIIFEADPYHAFTFIAQITGEYTVRTIHTSLSNRDLNIMINPSGWQLKETS